MVCVDVAYLGRIMCGVNDLLIVHAQQTFQMSHCDKSLPLTMLSLDTIRTGLYTLKG